MKTKFKLAYMDSAQRFAKLSSAVRLKVGAVIVNDDAMVYGYNGTPTGWDNVCEEREYMTADFASWSSAKEIVEEYPYEEENPVTGKVRYKLVTKDIVLHAESNAISKLAKSPISGTGASIFITHSPCLQCAKLIHQSGIQEVYYATDYRDTAGLDFLKQCNVKVEKLDV